MQIITLPVMHRVYPAARGWRLGLVINSHARPLYHLGARPSLPDSQPHVAAEQPLPCACWVGQTMLQPPQWEESVCVLISQPLVGWPSQSA